MATIYEVAELAGVSLATVSRVMNNSDKVSAKTRQKVEAAMEELGYRPNSIAQSLASKRSNSVGVLIPELYGPFFPTMLSGIEAELRDYGKHVIITAGHSDKKREVEGIEFLANRRCDALILYVDAVSDEYLRQLARSGPPLFLFNRSIRGLKSNCFNLDNEKGGYVAARILLEAGHREIAYITGPAWKKDAQERLSGHKRALAEFGQDFDERLVIEGNYQETGGKRGLKTLLHSGLRFSALVCANDEMAAGAVDVARKRGLEIPADLSVVGFDNVHFTRYMHPKLTTVDHPVHDMGRMAARAVLKIVYGHASLPVRNTFEPRPVMRDSVREMAEYVAAPATAGDSRARRAEPISQR
jgi:LacI family transcriptional regulator